MTDDATNYLNSPLPGCEHPPAVAWGDFAEMLDQERYRVPAVDEESAYMLRELSICFRRARADVHQLHRAARMLRELSQLWGRHHGPGWLLTPRAEQALTMRLAAEAADDPTAALWHKEPAEAADDDGPASLWFDDADQAAAERAHMSQVEGQAMAEHDEEEPW